MYIYIYIIEGPLAYANLKVLRRSGIATSYGKARQSPRKSGVNLT